MKKTNTPAETQNTVKNPKTARAPRKKKTAPVEEPATEVVAVETPAPEVTENTEVTSGTFPEGSSIYAWFTGQFFKVYVHNAADGKVYLALNISDRVKALHYAYILRKRHNLPISRRACQLLNPQPVAAEA